MKIRAALDKVDEHIFQFVFILLFLSLGSLLKDIMPLLVLFAGVFFAVSLVIKIVILLMDHLSHSTKSDAARLEALECALDEWFDKGDELRDMIKETLGKPV